MTITILPPDPAQCRRWWAAYQLQTTAWRLRFGRRRIELGETETEARARMAEHRKFKPEIEIKQPDKSNQITP